MSPTVFWHKNYRFFFFSREESRKHIHVYSEDGEAKFWIEPVVALADYVEYTPKQLRELTKLIESRKNEIIQAWKKHFES